MKSINRISATAFLLAASATFSPSAWSLGLGDAKVESYLDEPLKVSIDLISQASDDLASVSAQLASAADYELIGANRESISVPISFTVEDMDGDAYISASSALPVTTPVVRLIVEINWSSGRMLREYTLFLDPPAVRAPAPAPRMQAAEPAPVSEAPSAEPAQSSQTAATSAVAARVPEAGEYGPVQSGETLWAIAQGWSRQTGLDINRVMIAIQRENPEAFLNNNINLLKRGAILRMPAVSDVNQISRSSATEEVVAQEQEFAGRDAGVTAASAETPLLAEESAAPDYEFAAPDAAEAASEAQAQAQTETDTDSEAAAVADEIAAESPAGESAADTGDAPEPRDLLELVPPSENSELDSSYGFEESQEAGDAVVEVQTLREDLARTEEDLVTQQQQNEYLEQRIQELESQVDAAQGPVSDKDLATMEERLRQERQAAARANERPLPWYANLTYWLIGLLILAAAAIGWLLTTRGKEADTAGDDSIAGIQDEAEEVLQILGEPDDSAETEAEAQEAEVHEAEVHEGEAQEGDEDVPGKEDEDADKEQAAAAFGGVDDDAELLDEESSDPEIQLDLARAYISMGDKEAARIILEEVVGNGTDEQRADAEKMLNLL